MAFGRTRRSEESRTLVPQKRLGCIAHFFSVTLGTHEDTIQPVQIDKLRYKILRTSQCSLHAPIFEGQADEIRRDGRAPGHRKALHRKKSEAQNPTSSCRPADRRATSKAKSQDQGCPPKRVGIGDWTTKSASHGEPASDRVWLSEE